MALGKKNSLTHYEFTIQYLKINLKMDAMNFLSGVSKFLNTVLQDLVEQLFVEIYLVMIIG